MEGEGGGVVVAAAPMTPRRLVSQHSTLRDSFIASDIADGVNTALTASYDHNPTSPQPVSNLTLGAVLNVDKKSPPPNNVVVRTLLEVIRNDETLNGGGSPNRRKTWKSFREKLRRRNVRNPNSRRRASSMAAPQSDVLLNRNTLRNSLRNNSIRRVDSVPADDLSSMEVEGGGSPRRGGGSFRLSAVLAAEREQTRRRLSRELDEDVVDVTHEVGEDNGETVFDSGAPSNQLVRMSLMDLLEETDRQAGISGPTYRLGEEDEEEGVEEEEVADEELGRTGLSCCVCMVRHKGAAFIPCGHTFCRLCSKELFAQRGNCPLCNNFILEILNIF